MSRTRGARPPSFKTSFSSRPFQLTGAEIELLGNEKTAKFERSIVFDIFRTQFRIISVDNFIVGYAPFPDATYVISPYGTNKVLGQLYDYLVVDKPRLGPIPPNTFLPHKGKRGVDYFELYQDQDIRAISWYVISSTQSISRDFGTWACNPTAPMASFWLYVKAWSIEALDKDDDVLTMWPNVYWSVLTDSNVRLRRQLLNVEGVLHGRLDGEEQAMSQFTQPWTKKCIRGVVPNFQSSLQILSTEILTEG
jgi:hypothetical protein